MYHSTVAARQAAHSHRHNKRHVFRCSMSSVGPLAHRATHTVTQDSTGAEALTMIAITNQYHSQNFDIKNGIVSAGWKFQVPTHRGKHNVDSSKHFSKNLSFSHESIFKLEDELHIQVKLNSLNCYLVSIVHKNFTINICKHTPLQFGTCCSHPKRSFNIEYSIYCRTVQRNLRTMAKICLSTPTTIFLP